jgi:hypothetical protein
MLEFIKKLDVFGYRPQFLVSGNQKFKSSAGGFIFIAFFIFAIYYFISQTVEYLDKYNSVSNSRIVLIDSESYNISVPEMYLGIGIISDSHIEYNITNNFSYLDFKLGDTYINREGKRTDNYITLAPCDFNHFYDDLENNKYLWGKKEVVINRLKYYLCLPSNFTFKSLAYDFGEEERFIQIIVSLKNMSVLNYAQQHLKTFRPKLNFIFKNILVNTEDKYSPYSSNIDTFYNEIDYEFIKKTDLSLNPFEIFDDRNYFGNSAYEPVEYGFSNQREYTLFQISKKTDVSVQIPDRLSSLILELYKVKLNLNRSVNRCYRSYTKFTEFFAEVSAVLSNLLVFFAVIMIEYNSLQGTNDMIVTLFNNEKLLNMNLFTKDLKKKIKNKTTSIDNCLKTNTKSSRIRKSSIKDNQSLKSKLYLNKENLSFEYEKEHRLCFDNIVETEKNVFESVEKNNILIPITDDNERCESILRNNTLIKQTQCLEEIINNLIEENENFSFFDFLKAPFYRNDKHLILYKGLDNLNKIMDIQNYIKFNLGMSFIKQILFDKFQLLAFDGLFQVINCKTLFYDNNDISRDFSIYNKSHFEEFFRSFQFILQRQNSTDKKLLDFLFQNLEIS